MSRLHPLLVLIVLCLVAQLHAEDAYYAVPLSELKITEGKMPRDPATDWWAPLPHERALRVILEGEGEAYLAVIPRQSNNEPPTPRLHTLAVRAPAGREIVGRVIFPVAQEDNDFFEGEIVVDDEGDDIEAEEEPAKSTVVRFSIPADAAKVESKQTFLRTKASHYAQLRADSIPGTAWFRLEEKRARIALGEAPDADDQQRVTRQDTLDSTYDLFTGGRAVSENLQLDRVMPVTEKKPEATVAVDSIEGITVAEINWKEKVAGKSPQLDPLAAVIPVDQHAIFFPNMDAALAVLAMAEQYATPALQSVEPRAESDEVRRGYEQQFGYTVEDLAALAKQTNLVKGVAVTGSDPYVRVGTDIAVILETDNVEALHDAVFAMAEEKQKQSPRKVNGAPRSFVGRLKDKGVILTNSQEQMNRVVKAVNDESPSLASLDEYRFFRDRYARTDGEETAFLVLSDATIRRWCGPRWRIADSRRTRAAAILSEAQASHVNAIITPQPQDKPIELPYYPLELGETRLASAGVTSSIYGHLDFMTPIVELQFDKVTKEEADAYARWRDNYQENWRWAFDPIALQLKLKADRVAGDLTVMPLIAGSEYNQMIELSRGVKIAPGAADPHDALLHLVYAINEQSETMGFARATISQFMPNLEVNPLAWLGESIAFYVDDDPLWDAIEADEETDDFLMSSVHLLPIALHAEVKSGLKLTAFLAGVRAFIEQSAPGMTVWTPLKHNEQSYVKITPSEQARGMEDMLKELAIYYVASNEGFVLTLNENVLKRAIDRQVARRAAKGGGGAATQPVAEAWLGESVVLNVEKPVVDFFGQSNNDELQRHAQKLAWGNLPILNEWRRLYPDKDPVAVHEQLWGVKLVCPGGGTFAWNEEWKTMESTVYGHPAQPKQAPDAAAALRSFQGGRFGLTFESEGLRARADVKMQQPAGK